MALSDAHKAALAAGRARRAAENEAARRRHQEQFSNWSKRHAVVWARWQDNCGKANCGCSWCADWRWITSQIPDVDWREEYAQ